MKTPFIILFTVLLLISNNSFCQRISLVSYKTYFDKDLKSWTLTFKNFRLSKFKLTDTTRFEKLPFDSIKNLKEFYKLYKPALTFSTDHNLFIDIYSYWLNLEKRGNKIVTNTDVDQAVSLCDIKNNKWIRIFFCGYSTRVDEVIWLTNTRFILAGTEMDGANVFHPKIFIGDIKAQRFLIYKDSLSAANKSGYTSPKLKRLNIQDE